MAIYDDRPDTPLVMLATDGSDLATDALASGLDVVRRDSRWLIVTVVPTPDPSLVTGTGFAGGVMSFEEKQQLLETQRTTAIDTLERTRRTIGLADARTAVLEGEPGDELCRAAAEHGATVIVIGTRGVGGVRRAVLGSVSDHVVRNAPCPVLTVGSR